MGGASGEPGAFSSPKAVAWPVPPEEDGDSTRTASDRSLASRKGGQDSNVLEWNIEECQVKARRAFKKLRILDRVAGRAQSGDFIAVLGPSGCGKTTFLECLALRNTGFKGGIHLNGKSVSGQYFNALAYVEQHEMFFAHLTVREHLRFHAINRNGGSKTRQECVEMVESVMTEMGLRRCADTAIGGGFIYSSKGISGGERKRLAIASELLSQPSILLLDEPTSGLDSVMAELICLHLRSLTRDKNRIIMATIHSPTLRMWAYFTQVMLFAGRGGHVAYQGSKEGLDQLLAGVGLARPEGANPAEFYLEMVSPTRLDPEKGLLLPSEDYDVIYKAFEDQRQQQGFKAVPADNRHRMVRPSYMHRSSFLTQLGSNTTRFLTEVWRDKQLLLIILLSNQCMGLIFGFLYFNQISSGRNMTCMVFSLLITINIIANGHVALHFPLPYQVFRREVYSGANTSLPYFLASCMADFPRLALIGSQAIVPYFMVGMTYGAEFWRYMACVVLVSVGAGSVAYLGSSFSPNPALGILLTTVINTPMIMFGGLLYDPKTAPAALAWIKEVSMMRYGYSGVLANYCQYRMEDKVCGFWLSFTGVDPKGYVHDMLMLALLAVAFRAAGYMVMATKLNLRL